MGEDDIVELIWKDGQVVRSSQSQRPSASLIFRGSGSGRDGPPPQQPSHQNIFTQEDEMASWFQQDIFYSTSVTHSQSSVSLAPPPPPQNLAARRADNFMNFTRQRWNIVTAGRIEAGPWIPMVRESTQVGSNSTSSATGSCLTPATHGNESRATVIGGVSCTFEAPGLDRKEKAVAIEKVQIQPATEIPDDKKRKEREETIDKIEQTKEARGSTIRKRSRAAEMHNISERRRREKINEKMKAIQQVIPRCNKSEQNSMLVDAIQYVKALWLQIQIISTGGRMMPTANMQQSMHHMGMGMNRRPFIRFPSIAFPKPDQMPHPLPNTQAFDPPTVHLPSQQPDDSVSNQHQSPGNLNPNSQFLGLHQMQQPPSSLQNQPTSQLSLSQAGSSKEPEDQHNKPTG